VVVPCSHADDAAPPGGLIPAAPGPWRSARLLSKRHETPRAATLSFQLEYWPGHRAGQHVDVRVTAQDGNHAERSYSIASAPEDPSLELSIDRLDNGEVSPYLVEGMAEGDLVEIRGPIGGWFVWEADDGGPLLLIAGGSGIVPLMAMLRHRARRGSHVPVRLLVSVRTPGDLFYAEELRRLAAAGDGFELFVTATREVPSGREGLVGRIDQDMLAGVAWPPWDNPLAFVCGPASFVETASGLLLAAGYPPGRVRAERFGPSGP